MDKILQKEAALQGLLVHANSPYNDGWTREFYKQEYEKQKRKLERQKKRMGRRSTGKQ
jgi:hypothetical protein